MSIICRFMPCLTAIITEKTVYNKGNNINESREKDDNNDETSYRY